MELSTVLLAAVACALVGVTLSAAYACCERLRNDALFHLVSIAVIVLTFGLTVIALRGNGADPTFFSGGARFCALLCALLFYLPCLVFLGTHYWGVLLEKILSPGSRAELPKGPTTVKEWWDLLRSTMQALASDPNDVRLRLRLARIYVELGYYDSAAFEYLKAAEWISGGYVHAHILYKAGHLFVEKKNDYARAIPILRRLVRLYPKSYFAAYARRVINLYEAHSGKPPGAEAPALRKPL